MAMKISRRNFIRSAIACGILPDLAAASDVNDVIIGDVSEKLAQRPLRFLVKPSGEVRLADYEGCAIRWEAYDVAPCELDDPALLSNLLERITELRIEVRSFSWNDETEDYDLEDYDFDLVDEYVDGLGHAEHARLLAELRTWFAGSLSSEDMDINDIVRPPRWRCHGL